MTLYRLTCHHHSHSSHSEPRGVDRKGVKGEDKDRWCWVGLRGKVDRCVHADSVLRIPRVCVLFQNKSALLTQANTAPVRSSVGSK